MRRLNTEKHHHCGQDGKGNEVCNESLGMQPELIHHFAERRRDDERFHGRKKVCPCWREEEMDRQGGGEPMPLAPQRPADLPCAALG